MREELDGWDLPEVGKFVKIDDREIFYILSVNFLGGNMQVVGSNEKGEKIVFNLEECTFDEVTVPIALQPNYFIKETNYYKLGNKTMVCHLTLHNLFEMVGIAYCANKEMWSKEIGEQMSLADAKNKLMGYICFQETKYVDENANSL